MAATIETTTAINRQGSARAVAVISAAHFASHFYMLLLPPLFPMLRDVYGVGYTELGFAISVFSIATACTQVPVGFAVDRFGARRILVAGLLLEAAAFALIGFIPVYGALVALMAVAGLANAVYHPADYSLLNATVDPRRMGRAFSFHTSAGTLGYAVGPVTMVYLMTLTDWRTALMLCAAGGAVIGLMVASSARTLKERAGPVAPDGSLGAGATASGATGLRLLLSAPIVLGLLFFLGLSVSGHGIQSFSVSALHIIHDAPIAEATTVLTAYLFASPVGGARGRLGRGPHPTAPRRVRRNVLRGDGGVHRHGRGAPSPARRHRGAVRDHRTLLRHGVAVPRHAHPLDGAARRDREGVRVRVHRPSTSAGSRRR